MRPGTRAGGRHRRGLGDVGRRSASSALRRGTLSQGTATHDDSRPDASSWARPPMTASVTSERTAPPRPTQRHPQRRLPTP